MMFMKRCVMSRAVFWGILAFSTSVATQAWGFQQGGIFSPAPQQPTDPYSSGDPSQQANQMDSQNGQPDQQDQDSSQPRAGSSALTPSQQSRQNQLNSDQLNSNQLDQQDRNTESNDRTTNRQLAKLPVQLSDFQRLVAASIGKVLPIYGANLFLNLPSTFAPVNRIPVTPGYVIGPGDELLVRLWGQITLDGHFTVDRSGAIFIPKVGTIHVAGLPFDKLTDFLRSQIGRNFENFDLNVNMGQLRSIQIFVVGEAKRPGSYTVSSLSTLVNAIFSSGGPTSIGSMRNIQLRRGTETIANFDLYDLLIKGDKSKDVPLLSGDVVYIPPVGPMVALAGSVDKPALYELRDETTVKQVIALGGGLATLARHKDVRLERIRQQDDTRSVVDINLDDSGFATVLADGDILEISPIVDRFKNSVTLRGNVANPRRFAWFPGMRVRDLIPDKESLLTRDYWEQRNQLGLPTLDSTPTVRRYAPDDPVAQVNGTGISPSPTVPMIRLPNARDSDTNVFGTSGNNSYGANSNLANNGTNGYGVNGNGANGNGTDANGIQNSRASGSNSSTVIDSHDPRTDASNDRTSGTSISSAVTGTARRFPVKNSVVLSAPDIDWAYAVIERLDKNDLSSRLLSFDLGRVVLQGDASQNLELEPGDVVTIFSKADIRVPQGQQTKYVRLEGEFAAAGIYRVEPGENLRQLVARAGGITGDAYLYGSQFTRESARVIQQQRLDEYTDDLDKRIKLAEANSANNVTNPQDQLADVSSLQTARTIEANLRQARANGRIVLEIKPNASSLQDIPELPLEDGDTFIVPQIPLSVGVFGSVYTQNQFVYDPHKRAEDYIHLAGGGTRTADTGRSYIVRADGSIVSHQFSSSLFTGNFASARIYPGDALVIPERVDKRPLLRNLVDIATIVGQFGLGIAAVDVLR